MQVVASSAAGAPSLWRNRVFLTLWVGSFVSAVGDGITVFAIPLWLVLQGQVVGAGVVLLAPRILGLAWLPFAGVLGDRWDRRAIMLIADGVRALALIAGFSLWYQGQLTVSGLVVISCVLQFFSKLFHPALDASLRTVAGEEKLTQMQGAQILASRGVQFAAAVGGTVYALYNFGGALALDGITFLVSGGCVFLCRWDSRPRPKNRGPKAYFADLREGVSQVLHSKALILLMLLACSTNMIIAATEVLIPAHGVQRLHIGSVELGWIEAFIGIGFTLGTLLITALAGRLRPRAGLVILGGLGGSALGLVGFGLSQSLWAALFAICACVVAQGAAITMYASAMLRATPQGMTARVGALRSFVVSAAVPAGPLLGALLAHRLSPGIGMVIAGAVMLATAGVAAISRDVRSLAA